jgi:hypothetical protein
VRLRVELVVRLAGRLDQLLGLFDLLQHLLDVRAERLRQRMELLFQSMLRAFPLCQRALGFGVLHGQPLDRLGPLGEVLFRLRQLDPLSVQLRRRATPGAPVRGSRSG